jgi:LmeA-like phospholipid-binding
MEFMFSFKKNHTAKTLLVLATGIGLCAASALSFAQNSDAPVAAPATTEQAPSATSTGASSGTTMHAPIKAGGVMALDLPDSSAQAITLDITKGRFSDYSVGRVVVSATGMDFKSGTLQSLKTDIKDGLFENVPVEKLNIDVPGFSFDTMQLLNTHTFVLTQPVNGKVMLTLNEADINRFLANPKTIQKIEKSLQKQTGGLKLITFNNPNFVLMGGGKIKITVNSTVAQGLAVPLQMLGNLGIRNGQLEVTNLTMSSSGNNVQFPVDLATTMQNKINELIDFKRLGKNSLVIYADTMKQTGKSLILNGHATVTRLKFG